MIRLTSTLAIASLAFAGCAADSSQPEDGRDEAFTTTDGKLDGITATPGEAAAILDVVNTYSLAKLRNQVQLANKAAENIVAVRVGDDETAGTSDDETFGSLAELDAVPFVGPTAFAALMQYVHDADLVDDTVAHEWKSTTIVNGSVFNWTVDQQGNPVISYRDTTGAKIRLGNGTELALPAEATTNAPHVAVDETGTVHLFFRTPYSATPAGERHFAYRNGAWVEYDMLPGNRFELAQNASGVIFALTGQTSSVGTNNYVTASLVSVAANGSTTREQLWSVDMTNFKSDFEVDADGYPSLTYLRPWTGNSLFTWVHARRGPTGWQSAEVMHPDSESGNLIATTAGPSATIFMMDDHALTPFRQQGLAFAAGARSTNIHSFNSRSMDAVLTPDGTAHACVVEAGSLWSVRYDAAGAMTETPLGTADGCSMHVDNAGTVHMLATMGSVVNHLSY